MARRKYCGRSSPTHQYVTERVLDGQNTRRLVYIMFDLQVLNQMCFEMCWGRMNVELWFWKNNNNKNNTENKQKQKRTIKMNTNLTIVLAHVPQIETFTITYIYETKITLLYLLNGMVNLL